MDVGIKVLGRTRTRCLKCAQQVGDLTTVCPSCGDTFHHATTDCLLPTGQAEFDVQPFTGLPPMKWPEVRATVIRAGFLDFEDALAADLPAKESK